MKFRVKTPFLLQLQFSKDKKISLRKIAFYVNYFMRYPQKSQIKLSLKCLFFKAKIIVVSSLVYLETRNTGRNLRIIDENTLGFEGLYLEQSLGCVIQRSADLVTRLPPILRRMGAHPHKMAADHVISTC